MLTIKLRTGKPTLAEAASTLGLKVGDLDGRFGVRLLDPNEGLYAVRASKDAAATARGGGGPYSDPGIGLFGSRR